MPVANEDGPTTRVWQDFDLAPGVDGRLPRISSMASLKSDMPTPYRLMTISDANAAVGAAARLMMGHPAFAQRGFGEWMQVLDGEARRGHQVFVLDEGNRLVGYFGYAICTEAIAEAWAAGHHNPTDMECRHGDCLIFNAWISADRRVLRFMWNAFRRLARDKKTAFYKRFYPNGTMRLVRLPINASVEGHIGRSEYVWQELAATAAGSIA